MAWMGAVLGGLGKAAAGVGKGAKSLAKGVVKREKRAFGVDPQTKPGDDQSGNKGQGGKQATPSHETNFAANWANVPKMKKGGPIKRTGIYGLHKGEYVVPAKARSGKAGRKKAPHKKPVIKA